MMLYKWLPFHEGKGADSDAEVRRTGSTCIRLFCLPIHLRNAHELWLVECVLITGAGTSNLEPSPVPNLAPSLPQTICTWSLSLPCLISPNKRSWGGGEQNQEKSPGKMESETKSENRWNILLAIPLPYSETRLPHHTPRISIPATMQSNWFHSHLHGQLSDILTL